MKTKKTKTVFKKKKRGLSPGLIAWMEKRKLARGKVGATNIPQAKAKKGRRKTRTAKRVARSGAIAVKVNPNHPENNPKTPPHLKAEARTLW